MEWILKNISPQLLLSLLPMLVLRLGTYLKGRDPNNTGTDDAAGNICLALAPALDALDSNNTSAFKKALRVTRDTIDNYLTTAGVVLMMIFATAVLPVSAQDADKNTFTVAGAYVRRNVDVRLPNGNDFKHDADRDSGGFEVQYVRKVTGPLGIGIEGGASFHDQSISGFVSCGSGCTVTRNGTSKVALAWANYLVQLQARKGPIQPYAQATIGLHRSGFGGVTFAGGNAVSSSGSRFTWGGGGGVDVRLTKKTFLRAGLGVTKAFEKRSSDQWDAKLVLGISKRW